jgi:predicted DNA-binding protein (MmcQ/YjbR family)
MTRTITVAVHELCLGFPSTATVQAHGNPDFRVEGKTFATFTINHHGDGHVALWLRSPPGAQDLYCEMEPEHYFIPPYVGPRGWLGLELNRGLDWASTAGRTREAYEFVAPARLSKELGEGAAVAGPERLMTAEEINPFLGASTQAVLATLATHCEALPETSESASFGSPCWKAGKKTFVSAHFREQRLCLQFWVGPEQQSLLTYDERYAVPPYSGHNGWLELDVHDDANWLEIENLLLQSYRHFALKRMLKALDA